MFDDKSLRRMNVVGIGTLNIISGTLTAFGIKSALSVSAIGQQFDDWAHQNLGTTPDFALLFPSFLFSVAVQLAINWAWLNVFKYGAARRPTHMVMGLALSLGFSGVPAAATLAVLFMGDSFDRAKQAEAVQPYAEILERNAGAYGQISAQFIALATLSSEAALREEGRGNTCENQTTRKKCGSICNWRKSFASHVEQASGAARNLSRQSAALAMEVYTVEHEQLNGLYAEARSLRHGDTFATLQTTLDRSERELTEGFTSPTEGKLILCRDSKLLASVREAQSILETQEPLPTAPPYVGETGLVDGVRAILASFVALLPGGEPPSSSALAFLCFAWALEALLIGMLHARQDELRRSGVLLDEFEEFAAIVRILKPNEQKQQERIYRSLQHGSYRTGDFGEFYVLADDGPEAVREAGLEVVDFFDLKPLGKGNPIDLVTVDPDWINARRSTYDSATRFILYRLPASVVRWRRRALRDLMSTSSHKTRTGSMEHPRGLSPHVDADL